MGQKPAKRDPSAFEAFKEAPDSMQRISDHVQSGESLLSFCDLNGLAVSSVHEWIDADTARRETYARAKKTRADRSFEKIDEYSNQAITCLDPVKIQGLKLASDNTKWKLARMDPGRFGDKLAIGGAADLPPVQQNVTIDAAEAYKRLLGGEKPEA